jgi:hypothetical protein
MYLSWAMQEWHWFNAVQLFHSTPITFSKIKADTTVAAYLVPNSSPDASTKTLCGGSQPQLYTYNQGVIVAALAYLYQDTGDGTYLTDAEHIANAVLYPPTPQQVADAIIANAQKMPGASNIFTFHGVLNDPTSPLFSPVGGLGDGAEFKGIFVRDLRTLVDVLTSKSTPAKYDSGSTCAALYDNQSYVQCTTMYDHFFATQVCAIENVDTVNLDGAEFLSPDGWGLQPYALLGYHWTGPDMPYDPTTQVSAVEALVAALKLKGQPYPDCQRPFG